MIKLIQKFLVFTNLITFQKQPTGYCLLKAQSLFVVCTSIRGQWSWIAKQSLCPHHIDVVVAISAFSIQQPAVCIATYFNPEVFVLKKCFLQEVSFWMDNGHPSLQRNLTPRGNSSVSKCWTGLCSVLWWSWFELWTCTLPPLESAACFVQVGIQRHLFGYPGAGPGSWKRIASTVL